ncbi:MAG: hypothetical protein ACKVSF_07195 [Alphaproteobacteria bacterium]
MTIVAGHVSPVLAADGQNRFKGAFDFGDGSWSKDGVVLEQNVARAPDGAKSGSRIVEHPRVGPHRLLQIFTGLEGDVTISIYAQPAGRNLVVARIFDGAQSESGAYFDLRAGKILQKEEATKGAGVEKAANGWHRLWVVKTCVKSPCSYSLYLANETTAHEYPGIEGKGVNVWGAKLEAGSAPTPITRP